MWLFMVVACLIQQSANTEELIRKRHLNPQEFMNINEIINYWGYPSEEYQILTDDGYILQVNRIPYGVNSPGKTGSRPAVLLVHGFAAEGRSWIANIPSNSLGFVLADAGYDVWIINTRGTTWSRSNIYWSIDQEQFWDFSLHEIGIYDVPATINFILQKTQQDALYYVAHSQGATAGLIAFSTMPQLAQNVKIFIAFSPGYTLVGTEGFFALLLSLPQAVQLAIFGTKELCLLSNHIKNINANLCSYPLLDRLCLQVIFAVTGFNENNVNVNGNKCDWKEQLEAILQNLVLCYSLTPVATLLNQLSSLDSGDGTKKQCQFYQGTSRADVYAGIFPDFTSVKIGVHWGQIFKSHQFKQFDYGSRNNEVYNMTTPPFYKIEDMIVPTAVWYGGNDFIVKKVDMELLFPRIRGLVFQKYISSAEHFECIWGLDAPERIYPDMLFLMQQYK